MVTLTRDGYLPALDDDQRKDVVRELQATLVELIDLSSLGKHLHWNIAGRPFKPLHEHLDELVDSWRAFSDTVAERAVALGLAPDGRSFSGERVGRTCSHTHGPTRYRRSAS
jgi:starvation-inducible DNA-binding protein